MGILEAKACATAEQQKGGDGGKKGSRMMHVDSQYVYRRKESMKMKQGESS